MNTEEEKELSALLLRNELALMDRAVRRDRSLLLSLLAEDFQEIGASGRSWTRDEIVQALATQPYEPPAIEGFRCRLIAPGVALVTFKTVRPRSANGPISESYRSSLWSKDGDGWRLRYHQGTPAAAA